MSSREAILAALRRSATAPIPLSHAGPALGVRFEDPMGQFEEMVAAVGGACVRVRDLAEADAEAKKQAAQRAAQHVASTVPGVGAPNVDLGTVSDPHQLRSLDIAIVRGELAVAENGAVWISGRSLPQRAIPFICQHLILVVDARSIVHDMHQAYARLAPHPREWGMFLAGPSKTADIEQALVIGAHGARSCTVLLVGPA
jgi:L-lactate dehydrogenase complex protein LldG